MVLLEWIILALCVTIWLYITARFVTRGILRTIDEFNVKGD